MSRTKTIVIVDPEPVVRSVLQGVLEGDGYKVTPLGDPKIAAEILKTDPPELIITNVSLLGMTGHDAMKMFKSICPDVPVLMVSGLPDSDVIQHWMEEDGFDAFPKPFTAQQFRDKVRQVLAKSEAAR